MENIFKKYKFSIYSHYNKIGMQVSGGADSALLLYILLSYLEKYNKNAKLHILTCADEKKGYSNASSSVKVISRIKTLLNPSIDIDQYIFYTDVQTRDKFSQIGIDWFNQNKIDISLWGTTENPPYNEQEPADRPDYRNKGKFTNALTFVDNRIYHAPMIKSTKLEVAKIYKELNLEQTLFPYTRSCESRSKEKTNNFTTHCGECWWCWERKWAFGTT
jgi:7-cyano-7-deazaguanine synthase in queuosine biosynthesis